MVKGFWIVLFWQVILIASLPTHELGDKKAPETPSLDVSQLDGQVNQETGRSSSSSAATGNNLSMIQRNEPSPISGNYPSTSEENPENSHIPSEGHRRLTQPNAADSMDYLDCFGETGLCGIMVSAGSGSSFTSQPQVGNFQSNSQISQQTSGSGDVDYLDLFGATGGLAQQGLTSGTGQSTGLPSFPNSNSQASSGSGGSDTDYLDLFGPTGSLSLSGSGNSGQQSTFFPTNTNSQPSSGIDYLDLFGATGGLGQSISTSGNRPVGNLINSNQQFGNSNQQATNFAGRGEKICPSLRNRFGSNRCPWDSTKGFQLKIWPNNLSASICVAMTRNVEECQALCTEDLRCRAVHYCDNCSLHNCRLLSQKKSTSRIQFVDHFTYVDYHEKMACG